ncbi:glycosyltransferase [Arenibacter algicola]|uniref:N-acetylgalactosamine-N, N'-diacetylbacillosaminyl-diphospho-undecaprenol 4-alpha-N-acetylgalactosaminyltransferase n=1 Tax=Arenibacter algicola TaxID=616991 RepID=A0A221V307_9FLAO|nr:glycosyltransferase [Arenibacter algicola]ASO07977.1 N-acetylgalactosamine-N, N'-diacetylbacillosaminyl-diphospho-undecaprenol 4-alpha-N-acetylgalactosaminyltransferase [Arenibacter algicola]
MKQRILVFHPALAPYRVDFFNAVHHSFNAQFYFNLANVSDQKFDQENLKQRCDFTCNYLDKGFEVGGRSFRLGLIAAIIKHKPDIILCSEYSQITCFVLVYAKLFHKQTKVYTLSDDSIYNAIERKGIRSLLRKVMAKYIDGIIFTSEEVCNWHNENISVRTKTLELPIIHDDTVLRRKFLESLDEANKNIQKYDLVGKKVILFVGRLVEVKNLPFLIKCFSEVENHNCRLVLVGDGDLKKELKSLTVALNIADKVIFTGREEGSSLNNWYTFSQIFAFPSTNERYGAVVNEALLGGCYTLCSRAAGASSLIGHGNGQLFDPKNELDFIGKLQKAIYNSEPLCSEIKILRNSKMPFSFDQKIGALIKDL